MTTQREAIEAAGQIYGAILADPERAEAIRAHRAEQAKRQRDEKRRSA
jgi:hypothetical protein